MRRSLWRPGMKRQTTAAATAMVNTDYEGLSENRSDGHRAPPGIGRLLRRNRGNYEQAGGALSMPFSALARFCRATRRDAGRAPRLSGSGSRARRLPPRELVSTARAGVP